MGEIADGMVEGTLCQSCGMYIGCGEGFPRDCEDCQSEKRGESVSDKRMRTTKQSLIDRGWKVLRGPDHKSYTVISPVGKRFNFWPYKGWFAGPTQGRGFENLVKAGE